MFNKKDDFGNGDRRHCPFRASNDFDHELAQDFDPPISEDQPFNNNRVQQPAYFFGNNPNHLPNIGSTLYDNGMLSLIYWLLFAEMFFQSVVPRTKDINAHS